MLTYTYDVTFTANNNHRKHANLDQNLEEDHEGFIQRKKKSLSSKTVPRNALLPSRLELSYNDDAPVLIPAPGTFDALLLYVRQQFGIPEVTYS